MKATVADLVSASHNGLSLHINYAMLPVETIVTVVHPGLCYTLTEAISGSDIAVIVLILLAVVLSGLSATQREGNRERNV